MRIVVSEFISLDGVVQAPGGQEEDTEGGFAHGGWSMPYFDPDTMGPVFDDVLARAEALLFGRRTWQTMAAAWPGRAGDPFAERHRRPHLHLPAGQRRAIGNHGRRRSAGRPDPRAFVAIRPARARGIALQRSPGDHARRPPLMGTTSGAGGADWSFAPRGERAAIARDPRQTEVRSRRGLSSERTPAPRRAPPPRSARTVAP